MEKAEIALRLISELVESISDISKLVSLNSTSTITLILILQ